MKKIIKRFLTTDKSGRVLRSNTERLSDNGRGQINLTTRQSVDKCPSCNSVIADIENSKGKCDICRVRSICDNCRSKCQICSKNLCGSCKRGFVTNAATFTVCPTCYLRLYHRQNFNDSITMHKLLLQRRNLQQRELYLLRDLQLRMAKLRMNGQLHASRTREYRRINRLKEMNRYLIALIKARQNGRRHLR